MFFSWEFVDRSRRYVLLAEFKRSNDGAIAALNDYLSWLKKDLLLRSNGSFAIGAENYHLKVLYDEMVDVPLPRLLKLGYAQLKKDQRAFIETAKRIDPNKTPEQVLKDVEQDHPAADALLSSAQQQLDGMRQFLIDRKIINTQFLWVKNNPSLSKVRKLTAAGSNAEGWAHYAEEMMLDESFMNDHPKYRLTQLVDALLRDCRYIVGIRMHTQGLTMEQARKFFVDEGRQQPVVGEMETKRGTGDPTYLMYTLGKLEILKLRQDYQRKMGSGFSVQDFHDRFIKAGSPPVKIVRRELMGRDGPLL